MIRRSFFHQTFQVPKMEVLTYISCMLGLFNLIYVKENPSPKWPYKVQYLHFRYLKLLVIFAIFSCILCVYSNDFPIQCTVFFWQLDKGDSNRFQFGTRFLRFLGTHNGTNTSQGGWLLPLKPCCCIVFSKKALPQRKRLHCSIACVLPKL